MNGLNRKSIKKLIAVVMIAALPGTASATNPPLVEDLRSVLEILDKEIRNSANQSGMKRNQKEANSAAYQALWNNHYTPDGPGDQHKLGNLNRDGSMDNENTVDRGPTGSRGNGIAETNSQ